MNALHGLATVVTADPEFGPDVERLARLLAIWPAPSMAIAMIEVQPATVWMDPQKADNRVDEEEQADRGEAERQMDGEPAVA